MTVRHLEVLSVGVPQCDIIGQPGTLTKHLWILGSRYIFLNLVTSYIYKWNTYVPLIKQALIRKQLSNKVLYKFHIYIDF